MGKVISVIFTRGEKQLLEGTIGSLSNDDA